jgi:hypothetical protein
VIARALLAVAAAAMPLAATAQMTMPTIAAPAQPAAIPLGTGGVPEGAPAETWFRLGTAPAVRNVTAATLTPVLPSPDKATGAGVIVAPGGGFLMLSMESEGWQVARWLADHGIAAPPYAVEEGIAAMKLVHGLWPGGELAPGRPPSAAARLPARRALIRRMG